MRIPQHIQDRIKDMQEELSSSLGRRVVLTVEDVISFNQAGKIKDAIAAAAEALGLRIEYVTGRLQTRAAVNARRVIMWYLKSHSNYSDRIIARNFGRDRTTVIEAVHSIEDFLYIKDEETMRQVDLLKRVDWKNILNK